MTEHVTHARKRDGRWLSYCGCGWILGGLTSERAARKAGESHELDVEAHRAEDEFYRHVAGRTIIGWTYPDEGRVPS